MCPNRKIFAIFICMLITQVLLACANNRKETKLIEVKSLVSDARSLEPYAACSCICPEELNLLVGLKIKTIREVIGEPDWDEPGDIAYFIRSPDAPWPERAMWVRTGGGSPVISFIHKDEMVTEVECIRGK
jgi:hypothetical protein